MKIRHKPPSEYRSATLSPEYQAEVDASMARGYLQWEHEQAALRKAERRRAKLAKSRPRSARARRLTKRQLAELDAWIELERSRLQRVAGLMRAAPASSEHRGVKSYRPVPRQGEIL